MNRLLICAIFAVLGAGFQAEAQAQKIRFGAHGGLSASALVGQDVQGFNPRTGAAGGVSVSFEFDEIFALQPELIFVGKGAKSETLIPDSVFTTRINLSYLEVPILLKAVFPNDETQVRPTLFVGPTVSFLRKAVREDGLNAEVDEVDLKDELRSMDLGITFGGGLEYPIGPVMFSISARYTVGIRTIDSPSADDGSTQKIRNGSFLLFGGAAF